MENHIEVNLFRALKISQKTFVMLKEVNVRYLSKPLEILNSFLAFTHMKLRLTILGGVGKENEIKKKEINYKCY